MGKFSFAGWIRLAPLSTLGRRAATLVAGSACVVSAAGAQTSAELAAEAWEVRLEIAAAYGDPAASTDGCAVAALSAIAGEADAAGRAALERELQYYFEPPDRFLRPSTLWSAMLTPGGGGLDGFRSSGLPYEAWHGIAERVRDAMLATGFEGGWQRHSALTPYGT